MSSNDAAADQPLDDGSITPPQPDFRRPPPAEGERPPMPPGWQPELELPQRTVAQRPRWPHPNFWWSILWCLLFLFVTQIPGGVIAVIVAVGLMFLWPERFGQGGI